MNRRWPIPVVGLVLAGLVASASRGTTGAAFLDLPLSVRQAGMGDVGIGGHDVMRAWSNPASLADQTARGEAAINGASLFGGDEQNLGLGVGWRVAPAWTVGALVSSFGASLPEIDANGDRTGRSLDRSLVSGGVMGAGQEGPLRLGLLVRFVRDTVLGDVASPVAADLGAALAFGPLETGVALRNLGGNLQSAGLAYREGVALPLQTRVGAGWRFADWHLSAGAEAVFPTALTGTVGAGLEWWPVKFLAVRAGVSDVADPAGRMAAGLSVEWTGVVLDYAFAAHAIGPSQRMSLSYLFGGLPGSPAPGHPATVVEPLPLDEHAVRIAVLRLRPLPGAEAEAAEVSDEVHAEMAGLPGLELVTGAAGTPEAEATCGDPACALAAGNRLGVAWVVCGTVERIPGSLVLNLSLISVAAGSEAYNGVAQGSGITDLRTYLHEMAFQTRLHIR